MKNQSRARRNGGKKATAIQSGKTTDSRAEKPVVETTDVLRETVQTILAQNQTGLGLTVEAIACILPRLGIAATFDQVEEVLATIERAGTAECVSNKQWKFKPAPAIGDVERHHQPLSPAQIARKQGFEELETATNQARALFELMQYHVVRPADDCIWGDELVCGLTDLIHVTAARLSCAGEALRHSAYE